MEAVILAVLALCVIAILPAVSMAGFSLILLWALNGYSVRATRRWLVAAAAEMDR